MQQSNLWNCGDLLCLLLLCLCCGCWIQHRWCTSSVKDKEITIKVLGMMEFNKGKWCNSKKTWGRHSRHNNRTYGIVGTCCCCVVEVDGGPCSCGPCKSSWWWWFALSGASCFHSLTEFWHMAHFWMSYGRCTIPGSPMGWSEGFPRHWTG